MKEREVFFVQNSPAIVLKAWQYCNWGELGGDDTMYDHYICYGQNRLFEYITESIYISDVDEDYNPIHYVSVVNDEYKEIVDYVVIPELDEKLKNYELGVA